MSGGLLPAAVFILKDFVDSIPRSYEESARVFGASPVPVVVLYLVVNKRYGFSFQGGING